MTSITTTSRRRTASARAAAETPAEADDAPLEYEALPDDDQGDAALDGVVVPPELVFVTPKKDRPEQSVADRSINFSIDGEIYRLIRPAKLQEAIAGLIESGARRATEADVLFAGSVFLRKVLAPESLARINARLEDDADDFEIGDLFDTLERIALTLIRSAPNAGPSGPVPARRRAVGR